MPALRKVENRAKLIARDQVSKLNGEIAQLRQRNIGIERYYWRTMTDERVRPEHQSMDGLMCRWDDPSVYSADKGKTWKPRTGDMVRLHPSEDYQCRCYADPVFDELL